MKTLAKLLFVLTLLVGLSGCTMTIEPEAVASESAAAPQTTEDTLTAEIEFVTHIEFGAPEQDVFSESDEDPSQVVRVKGEAATDPANLEKPVYTSAEFVEHDAMELGENPLGPFAKGEPLGFTLGEWLAATGKGTYMLYGNEATLSVELQNLVPNAVYSAWCGRLGFEPSFAAIDMPCGPLDGSQSAFETDADGNASFEITMHAHPASDAEYFADIAFAYHSDGQTHGVHPGEFGKNSHVQLFILDPVPAPVAREPIQTDVEFVTHVEFGMPEQDVYIESTDDATQVVRPLGAADDPAAREQMLYAAAEPIEHDPPQLGANPRGPFSKGEELGITLDAWLAATGSGTYTVEGDQATLDVTFENLVPNGIYTAWCGIITVDEEFIGVDIPCGPVDGSQAKFQADAQGNATYQVTMPALPASDETTFSDIAFAYHSDGETCGSSPCDFGLNSHVQLFISEPPPAPQDLPAR